MWLNLHGTATYIGVTYHWKKFLTLFCNFHEVLLSCVLHTSRETICEQLTFQCRATSNDINSNRSLTCQRVYYNKHWGRWMKLDGGTGQEHKRLPLHLFWLFQPIASSGALTTPDLPQSITFTGIEVIFDTSYQLDLQLLQMQLNQTRQEIFLVHPHPNAKRRGRECN